ncbi:MAG: RNA polymerase sigma factor [Gemmatimonadota bacterium]|nr:MAG: RNA polymerase sigma factor [Gemmatimonadota bacterium]
MPDDHELMMAVRDGDLDRLGPLFEKHNRHLYNFFFRQTRDPHTSEDLVQDVFHKILRYRHTYRGESKFTTWMFSIAHNSKIDYYRKNKHQGDQIELSESLVSSDPTPEDTSLQKDEKALLMKALRMLSEEKREVLLLSRFQNMKYEEIAKILGCKVGTIKARVHWALKDLTNAYHKLAGSDAS